MYMNKKYTRMNRILVKPIFLSFLLLVFGWSLKAQTRGKAYDAENQTPLEEVLVIAGDQLLTRTGANGTFTIPSGVLPDTLTFRHMGYHTQSLWVEPADSLITINLVPRSFEVGDVIIKAYHAREKAFEADGPINTLNAKEIRNVSSGSAEPVLNSLPGLYMHSGARNTNRITIRGIGSRSQYTTTKIKAYLNGIPLTSGVGETTLEDLDLNLVDRITVLKGPSSSIHGAALGGTILYRMGLPSQKGASVRQELMVGEFNMFQNSTHLTWKGDKTGIQVAYDKFSDGGFRQNDQYNRDALTALVRHQLTPDVGLTYLGRYHRLKAYIPSSLDEETYLSQPSQAADNWNAVSGHEQYNKMLHGLSLDVDFNEQLRSETSLFLKQYNGDEVRPFNILDDQTRTTGGRSLLEYTTGLANGQFKAEAGYEFFREAYEWDIYETLQGGDWGSRLHSNKQYRTQHNLFSSLSMNWERLGVSLGVNLNRTGYRYNDLSADSIDYSDQKNYQWIASPRLSLTYGLSEQWMLFGMISHGFSAPSYEETLNARGFVDGSIQPETGWNREVGLRARSADNRWLAKVSAYSISVRNLLVTKRLAEDRFQKINAGETRHNGLEIMGKARWLNLPWLESQLNLSYMFADYKFMEFTDEGQDHSGNNLPGIPEHKIALGVNFDLPEGLYLRADWLGVGRMPMNDGNTLYSESYNRLNLKAGIRKTLSENWMVNLHGGIKNATDQHYASMILINAPSFGGAPPRYYYPAEPSTFFGGISIQYAFGR